MNIYEKLLNIQTKLKAPKNQRNNFGNYNYRSCEDILEAVKPICLENKTTLVLSDEVINVNDRYYIKATATLYDVENENQSITNTAFARESETKKGMDDSQITGTASSYARKYALNGLFNIDDTKDADTNEYHNQTNKNKEVVQDTLLTDIQAKSLYKALMNKLGTNEEVVKYLSEKYKVDNTSKLIQSQYVEIVKEMKK